MISYVNVSSPVKTRINLVFIVLCCIKLFFFPLIPFNCQSQKVKASNTYTCTTTLCHIRRTHTFIVISCFCLCFIDEKCPADPNVVFRCTKLFPIGPSMELSSTQRRQAGSLSADNKIRDFRTWTGRRTELTNIFRSDRNKKPKVYCSLFIMS